MDARDAAFLAFVILLLAACAPAEQPVTVRSSSTVTLRTTPPLTFAVEVADTPEARRSGLMGRATLPEGEGMLFVFEGESTLRFWMKDTLLPLDIVYINSSLQVVDVQRMLPCLREPCEVYTSAQPAMYALEVGAYAAKGVEKGTALVLSGR